VTTSPTFRGGWATTPYVLQQAGRSVRSAPSTARSKTPARTRQIPHPRTMSQRTPQIARRHRRKQDGLGPKRVLPVLPQKGAARQQKKTATSAAPPTPVADAPFDITGKSVDVDCNGGGMEKRRIHQHRRADGIAQGPRRLPVCPQRLCCATRPAWQKKRPAAPSRQADGEPANGIYPPEHHRQHRGGRQTPSNAPVFAQTLPTSRCHPGHVARLGGPLGIKNRL